MHTLTIETAEVLLLIAAIVSMLARRLRVPYTAGLVVAGLGVSFIGRAFDVGLTNELIYSVFLPPLVFEAAYQTKWKPLVADLAVISTLSILGVLLSAGVCCALMHYLAGWEWQPSLLFGILISATDPVAVLAMFKEWAVAPRLKLLIESESLINDGSVAVLFAVALAAVAGAAPTASSVVVSFAQNLLGGIGCGAAVGFGTLLLAGTAEEPFVEITFTTVAAFGSFLLAQHLGCSGILSTMTAGIIIGNLEAWNSFTTRGRTAVDSFWQYAAFVVNSLIFLLIGIRISKQPLGGHLLTGAIAIGSVLVARMVGVVACTLPFMGSKWKVSGAHQTILIWGGMRGALALALALSLPDMPRRAEVTAAAFAVVAFSILVQGMTLSPLIARLD